MNEEETQSFEPIVMKWASGDVVLKLTSRDVEFLWSAKIDPYQQGERNE